jgi:hypothetical protein
MGALGILKEFLIVTKKLITEAKGRLNVNGKLLWEFDIERRLGAIKFPISNKFIFYCGRSF